MIKTFFDRLRCSSKPQYPPINPILTEINREGCRLCSRRISAHCEVFPSLHEAGNFCSFFSEGRVETSSRRVVPIPARVVLTILCRKRLILKIERRTLSSRPSESLFPDPTPSSVLGLKSRSWTSNGPK